MTDRKHAETMDQLEELDKTIQKNRTHVLRVVGKYIQAVGTVVETTENPMEWKLAEFGELAFDVYEVRWGDESCHPNHARLYMDYETARKLLPHMKTVLSQAISMGVEQMEKVRDDMEFDVKLATVMENSLPQYYHSEDTQTAEVGA